jgi:hypothetical protein
MWTSGKDAATIVKEQGLVQISDAAPSRRWSKGHCCQPTVDCRLQGRQRKGDGFLVGQVMKETKGRANPNLSTSCCASGCDWTSRNGRTEYIVTAEQASAAIINVAGGQRMLAGGRHRQMMYRAKRQGRNAPSKSRRKDNS